MTARIHCAAARDNVCQHTLQQGELAFSSLQQLPIAGLDELTLPQPLTPSCVGVLVARQPQLLSPAAYSSCPGLPADLSAALLLLQPTVQHLLPADDCDCQCGPKR